jgi:molybdopterin-guanine dinucleotide biosynthesis protein MobB
VTSRRDLSQRSFITGVLLAGGHAHRMGFDKRALRIGDATLLERNGAVLREVFSRRVLSVRPGAAPEGAPPDFETVYDEQPGSPLSGIVTSLAHVGAPVFVLAADMAFTERAAIHEVVAAFDDVDVALPVVNSRYEPLHAVYSPRCLPLMREMLAQGDHTIPHLYERVKVAEVPFASEALFFNVNTPADLEEARRRLEREGRALGMRRPAIVCIVGKSGSGKTTLLEALIPELRVLGLRVAAVKHDADDIDVRGRGSWRPGDAAADTYLVHAPDRLVFVAGLDEPASLRETVLRYLSGFDLVVVEGHDLEAPYKVEVFRQGVGHAEPPFGPGETVAFVTDADVRRENTFGLGEAAALARFLAERLDLFRRY